MTGKLEMAPLNTVALIHVPSRQRPLEMDKACRYPSAGESGGPGRGAGGALEAVPQGSPYGVCGEWVRFRGESGTQPPSRCA